MVENSVRIISPFLFVMMKGMREGRVEAMVGLTTLLLSQSVPFRAVGCNLLFISTLREDHCRNVAPLSVVEVTANRVDMMSELQSAGEQSSRCEETCVRQFLPTSVAALKATEDSCRDPELLSNQKTHRWALKSLTFFWFEKYFGHKHQQIR
jgi:hypothetical protein